MNNVSLNNQLSVYGRQQFSGVSDKEKKQSSGNAQVETSDYASISSESRLFYESGLDIKNSNAEFFGESLAFNLSFNLEDSAKLTANGIYFSSKKTLNISLQYQFEQIVQKDGKTEKKKYQLEFIYNSELSKKRSAEANIKKEDITDFVRRLVDKILSTAKDKQKSVGGVSLNEEDLKDILAIEDEKVRETLISIINMAMAIARFKDKQEDDEDAKVTEVSLKRKKWLELILNKEDKNNTNISLSIEEISSEIIEGSSDKKLPADEKIETKADPPENIPINSEA